MGVRWGVAGTGGICRQFGAAVKLTTGGELVAVGSRSAEGADSFGDRFDVARRHASYEALAADPDVDAVYVGTPHSRHEADTLMFLEAGKHVLCEKPMSLSEVQTRRMVDCSRSRGLFLMEAIWSRFLPAYRLLVDLIADGRIGTVRQIEASFGFARPVMAEHRLFDRALGGGATLDLGIYPLQLCSLLLGPPDNVEAVGHVGETLVDEQMAAVLHHRGGAIGVVQAAIRANLRCDARIVGDTGVIELPPFMHCPDHLTVSSPEGAERIDAGWEGEGLRFEVEEVHRCLAEGLTESLVVPLDESIQLATTMDEILGQVGVTYGGAS